MTYTWSHEADIATINSDDAINFTISVEKESIDPITQETVIELVNGLQLEQIETDEIELLPDDVVISESGTSVSLVGPVKADARFIEMAYSLEGDERPVDEIEEIPFGSKVFKLIPDDKEYKYFKWRVFSESDLAMPQRIFTLAVRMSWDSANKTIKRLASEIQ
jgi:hypothetical protein